MPRMGTIEVWVALNEEGKYECGCSDREAGERLVEAYSGRTGNAGEPIRMICLTLTVAVPETLHLSATVPPENESVELKIS